MVRKNVIHDLSTVLYELLPCTAGFKNFATQSNSSRLLAPPQCCYLINVNFSFDKHVFFMFKCFVTFDKQHC